MQGWRQPPTTRPASIWVRSSVTRVAVPAGLFSCVAEMQGPADGLSQPCTPVQCVHGRELGRWCPLPRTTLQRSSKRSLSTVAAIHPVAGNSVSASFGSFMERYFKNHNDDEMINVRDETTKKLD